MPAILQDVKRILFTGDSLTDGSSYPDYVVNTLNRAFCGACLSPDGTSTYEILRVEDKLEVHRVAASSGERTPVCTAPVPLTLRGCDGKLSDGSWQTPPDGSWRWENMPPEFPRGEGSITAHHVLRDDGSNWRMVPDGKYVVFQSDFTGRPQVNVAYGYEWPGKELE